MENVNKQLLDALKELVSIVEIHSKVTDDNFAWAEIDFANEAIAAAEQAQQAEPVAAQCRFEGEEWKYCTIAHHLLVQAHPKEWPHYETRALYAQPPAVPVPDAAVGKLRILLAACNRIEARAEEFESQDGVEMAIAIDYWLEFIGALDAARAMLAAAPQATAEDSSVVQADAPAPATEYGWSSNGEEYHGRFSSVAEAVCDYLDSYGDDAEYAVHIGEVKPHDPGKPIWLADNVLETLSEQAYGDVGEFVGDWPELPPEKREQLGKMIQDYVWTHNAPRFFSIGKSELVEVAPYRDDAAAQKGGA